MVSKSRRYESFKFESIDFNNGVLNLEQSKEVQVLPSNFEDLFEMLQEQKKIMIFKNMLHLSKGTKRLIQPIYYSKAIHSG